MVHTYQMNGYDIALDVNSGAVHVLDGVSRAVLTGGDLSAYADAEIAEARAELQKLRDDGLLDSDDLYEQGLAPDLPKGEPVVKALCLLVAHDCNMACAYCFAEEGAYHGARGLMSPDTAKAAVDFLLAHSGSRRNLEIDFFGGEPLLNWDVVTRTVEYGEARAAALNKRFRFTMTTNGLLLDDEKIDYLNAHMANVVLSLDGRKAVNDALRTDKGGRGVYDRVVPAFQKLAAKRGGNYYVRGTFTRANMDFSEDVFHLAELGFGAVSVEPAVGGRFGFTEDDLPALYAEYERLAAEMLKRKAPFTFFHFMIDLTGGPCARKRLSGCGAGGEYAAVAANGDLYPCHQFAGNAAYQLGDVFTGEIDANVRRTFENCHIYAKDDCKACWAKFYCGGGCPANAFEANGDICKPYAVGCALQKKRVECAIMLQAAKAQPRVKDKGTP